MTTLGTVCLTKVLVGTPQYVGYCSGASATQANYHRRGGVKLSVTPCTHSAAVWTARHCGADLPPQPRLLSWGGAVAADWAGLIGEQKLTESDTSQ
jgi:hypothetical protein